MLALMAAFNDYERHDPPPTSLERTLGAVGGVLSVVLMTPAVLLNDAIFRSNSGDHVCVFLVGIMWSFLLVYGYKIIWRK